MTRLVLDAGALIAADRRDTSLLRLVAVARNRNYPLVSTSPVVGQVWRDGRKQANLARFLRSVDVRLPTEADARAAGMLLARTGTSDVIDALVAGLCSDADVLLTSDAADLKVLTSAARVAPEIVKV